jgi:hypothetical protein
MLRIQSRNHLLRIAICVLVVSLHAACGGAIRPPDATRPKGIGPAGYPVSMTENQERRDAVLAAWKSLIREQGIKSDAVPELQPVTETIRSLPPSTDASIFLPKVGNGPNMTEEETRESLRRFIVSATDLIGAQPKQLSLVQRTDTPDGAKTARYRQRPFRYQLRGGFGVLEIGFFADRRISKISSTCIPDVEALQRAGAGVTVQIPAEEAPKRLAGNTLTYADASGSQATYTISPNDEIAVQQLVVYPRLSATKPSHIEFHLAWEIKVGNNRTAYLDAVNGELIGAA